MAAKDLELMRLINAVYMEFPYHGTRQMRRALRAMGSQVGRRRVRRLMRLMGLEALCPKPNLSKPVPGHKIYPYLMKGLKHQPPGPGQVCGYHLHAP